MQPTRRPLAGQGSSVLEKGLSGLSDFGKRSLNLSVLVNDKSLKEAYAAAQTNGELPANRARVLILGEPRSGKTSLLNRLLGRPFDIHEQPTHGIETRMCHVTNVDKRWNESGGARADDIRECASAVTVLGEVSPDGASQVDENCNSNFTKPTNSPVSPDSSKNIHLLKVSAMLIAVSVALFTLGMFYYSYVIFVWFSIAMMSLVLNHNNAYRFGTSISLVCILFEAIIRNDQALKELSCKKGDEAKALSLILSSSFFNFLNTVILGVASGLGSRTGIVVAFSVSSHPLETELTAENILQGVKISWGKLGLTGLFGLGGVIGLLSFKYCTADDRWHKRRAALCLGLNTLLIGILLKAECRNRPYWFIFLNGIVMTVGGTWGAIFGRRLVVKYGFEASYITKKTVGLFVGAYLARMCGWSFKIPSASLPSVAFYVLSFAAHPLFDLHTAYRIWRIKQSFPVKVIRNQMKAVVKGHPLLETKLSLWDFAGDRLYHCAHHVFMPDRALYLIVFNLEAAVSQEDEQLRKLLFWLHSVCAHARHPDAVIMIVGTHKASVSEARKMQFADKLRRQITATFCHRLVLNSKDDKPLFLVENSQTLDQDFEQLRAEIFRRVETAEYAQEKYPIRYLNFYREIQKRRKLAELDHSANVMTLQEVRELVRESFDIAGENFKKMLRFFNEAGEIIHKDDDDELQRYVVLDPQFLVDIMRKLVQVPRASSRSHRYALDWINYEEKGIITRKLLEHIYSNMPHLISLLTHLLQAYDLMCPVESPLDASQRSYLVPAMLPPYRNNSTTFWEPMPNEKVFYFDFGFFDPSTVFHRLLTRCLSFASLDKSGSGSEPLIFADRSRFYIGTSFIFKLQLERRSSQQMLLSVTMLAFDSDKPPSKLLKFLVNVVTSITARDYPHLKFTFGPRCPFCASKSECPSPDVSLPESEGIKDIEEAIHILKMAGHDKLFPNATSVVMLCGQKRFQLNLDGDTFQELSRQTSQLPQPVSFSSKSSISKLPPDLFHRMCLLLNSSLTRNWKTLAGELGKDVESVTLLDSERASNPTERLLQEWAMTDGAVTVGELLEVLGRPSLMRMDIIGEIRAQMSN